MSIGGDVTNLLRWLEGLVESERLRAHLSLNLSCGGRTCVTPLLRVEVAARLDVELLDLANLQTPCAIHVNRACLARAV